VTLSGLFAESLPVRYLELQKRYKKELKLLQSRMTELAIVYHDKSLELLVDGKTMISSIAAKDPYDSYKRLVNGSDMDSFECLVDGCSGLRVSGWITPPVPTPWSMSIDRGPPTQLMYLNNHPINANRKLVKLLLSLYARFEIRKVSFIISITADENRNYYDVNVSVDKREVVWSAAVETAIISAVEKCISGMFDNREKKEKRVFSEPPPTRRPCRSTEDLSTILAIPTPSLPPVVETLPVSLPLEIDTPPPLNFSKEFFNRMEILGQFNNGFIIARLSEGELFLIDQHAANEKFLFEQYFDTIRVNAQVLIIPIKLRLKPWIEEIILEHVEVLGDNGFGILYAEEGVPGERIALRTLPTLSGIGFNRSAALSINDFLDIVHRLDDESAGMNVSERLGLLKSLSSVRAMFASKACRTAVMVGDPLDFKRMNEIVTSLSTLQQPWNCPHGRPTMKHLLSISDLSSFSNQKFM
jgi:DNA mismatch repair ATPase MutL